MGIQRKPPEGVIQAGLDNYYRKVRSKLEGRPKVNSRSEDMIVQTRRAKLGAGETWFTRRRGGQQEREKKENGWRFGTKRSHRLPGQPENRSRRQPQPGDRSRRQPPAETQNQDLHPEDTNPKNSERKTVATLLVPYTIGSKLKEQIQKVEDNLQHQQRQQKPQRQTEE